MLARLLGQMVAVVVFINTLVGVMPQVASAKDGAGAVKIVAFGDSLTAGYGVEPKDALPRVLQRLAVARGLAMEVVNAGVSGDTTSGGLQRLDWAVTADTDGVILALGANDMLRGQPPAQTRANLERMVEKLKARNIPVLLVGMRASRNLGDEFANAFDRIYPEIAEAHDLLHYPFLLAGVALDPKLNQADGIHPNAAGVEAIAKRMLPAVEKLVALAKARSGKVGSK